MPCLAQWHRWMWPYGCWLFVVTGLNRNDSADPDAGGELALEWDTGRLVEYDCPASPLIHVWT
jgi:hypothetical protein